MTKILKNIKVIAFDCDGVLFNTIEANMAYYNNILNHFKKPDLTIEQFNYAQSQTAENAMINLFKNKDELNNANIYRKTIGYLPFIKYMIIEPYLKTLLKNLKPKYKTAICTNRSDTMGYVLDEFELNADFDFVVTSLDVKNPKPHPEPLNKIINYFKIKPYELVYIGDSKLDEQAANAINIPFISFNNPNLNADNHINNFQELEKIIED